MSRQRAMVRHRRPGAAAQIRRERGRHARPQRHATFARSERARSIARRRSSRSIGFVRVVVAPRGSRQRSRSPLIACAVSATIGAVVALRAQARRGLVAIEDRHLHVHEHEVVRFIRLGRRRAPSRSPRARSRQRRRALPSCADGMPDQTLIVRAVLDEQHAPVRERLRFAAHVARRPSAVGPLRAGARSSRPPSIGPVAKVVTTNVLPRPRSDSNVMSPPSMRASRREMPSPSPVPPNGGATSWYPPARRDGRERSISSRVMPMPGVGHRER